MARPLPRLAAALLAVPLLAQAPAPPRPVTKGSLPFAVPDAPFQSDVARLLREIAEHQEAMANLEEMCDTIGPRLTGSERLRKAQRWAMAKLKTYGATEVHEEAYAFGLPWTRGKERGRLLNANGLDLHLAQAAWTPGTGGVVRGPVTLVEAAGRTPEELAPKLKGLDGRIVAVVGRPDFGEDMQKDPLKARDRYRAALSGSKFAALLLGAGKKDDLLNMTGSPLPEERLVEVPTAFLSGEHLALLKRLAARGVAPEVELELGGALGSAPVQAYNVVAEIRGSERPEEVVIVGGHQDSWDLGTGATDNGTGTVAAMEVLRAVKALGLKPRRTLRVVLFSGEEQGLLGSEAYVRAHAAELGKVQAVLVDDLGSGRITGWPDMGQEACRGPLAAAIAPVHAEGCVEVAPVSLPDVTDHWPFHLRGVPAFAAIQEPLDYFTATHHSQVDTPDHVVKEDLTQGCQVLAATAWAFLNGEALPRHAPLPDRAAK